MPPITRRTLVGSTGAGLAGLDPFDKRLGIAVVGLGRLVRMAPTQGLDFTRGPPPAEES